MKVSIGSKIVNGPWGGGNLFVMNLTNYLRMQGHEVIYDLCDSNIDVILLTDPRKKNNSSSKFNHKDIHMYKKYVNKNVVVVQRINECDQRKNTNNVNDLYYEASKYCDFVIFVSSWLRDIYLELGIPLNKTKVIYAGADSKVFNSNNSKIWNQKEKFKLVTHHWSSHLLKGFLDYQIIDNLLNQKKWNNKLHFTYIGNINKNFNFKNFEIIQPLHGYELAEELKKSDFYFTASVNEPSGNHHIEAAQCGLPIIFKNSGGIPEYCKNFGISYDEDPIQAIEEAMENYFLYKKKIQNYPNNALKMSKEFETLFIDLFSKIEIKNYKQFKFLSNLTIKYFKFKNFSSNLWLSTISKLSNLKTFLFG